MNIDDVDYITEADVKDGFLIFYEGWKSGKNHEMQETGARIIKVLGDYDDSVRGMLMHALRVLDLDYYGDQAWDSRGPDIDPAEEVFEEWRETHPRDPSSPRWNPTIKHD